MRKLVITQNITIDGRIDMLGDWFDPTDQDPDLLAELRRQDETCDAVLLGRETFEAFRGFWPAQDDDATGITHQLNTVDKYVVSRTMTDPRWQNSTVITDDVVGSVRRLKDRTGQDIVCTGSVSLCHTLLAEGLVDELRLFTYPVIQGEGRGLVPEGFSITPAVLTESKSFGNGVTYTGWRLDRQERRRR
ncbi:dihydrofolate reductase [Kocuria sp. JC486]|uniref:dihydrofolate reductase family protein n=1 Tax=Kocuria sp. JC486 TaxID=1970736 RepID=UPI00141F8179|nr:dihydrofolate reductase family protein [Kocuria sp. JC486]NHU84172.1 dihydrofolate reductase [Kocuria sp. JC486]